MWVLMFFFSSRRRHTRLQGDWSSDVCSSDLGTWFHASAASGSLALYLRGFAHTIAVMQTPEAIERVAFECGEDLARDGVVYAESRYAPVFSTARGLSLQEVVDSVGRGFRRAEGRF